MYLDVGGATQHAERRNQAHQPEPMVAVQVRYEYVVQPCGAYAVLYQTVLCAFAAVYQKLFIAQFEQLRGLKTLRCRHGRTRPEYGELHQFHRQKRIAGYFFCTNTHASPNWSCMAAIFCLAEA